MRQLSAEEMSKLEAEGFWGGLGCGMAIAASFYSAVSPDPFSKIALLTYSGNLLACARLAW